MNECSVPCPEEENKKYLIIHHNDNDGICAGALVYQQLVHRGIADSNIYGIETNYVFDKVIDILKDWDLKYYSIIIVDVSFTVSSYKYLIEIASYSTNTVYWFDHHDASVEVINNKEILAEIQKANISYTINKNWCGAALVCYPGNIYDKRGKRFPDIVRYIDDHDRWVHKCPESIKFFYGFQKTIPDVNNIRNPIWNNLFQTTYDPNNENNLLTKIIKSGENIVEYSESQYSLKRKSLLIHKNIIIGGKVYNALLINHLGNSFVFGDMLDDADIGIFFVLEKSLEYRYTISTTNPDINCCDLAKLFGGDGHAGIAGFRSTKDPIALFNLKEVDVYDKDNQ